MTPEEFTAWKRSAEARRDLAAGDMTWKQIEDLLTWAENQLPPEQQRNRPRVHPASRPTPLES